MPASAHRQAFAPKTLSMGERMRIQAMESKWMSRYRKCNAFFDHDGHPHRPHPILTGGFHADHYFNTGVLIADPRQLHEAAADLLELLVERGLRPEKIDFVIGPAMGAITLAEVMALHISRPRSQHAISCFYGHTIKGTQKQNGQLEKVMLLSRVSIRPDARVLIVDDVRSNGHTGDLTAQAIRDAGGKVVPFRGVLVNRSGQQKVGDVEVVSLINRQYPMHAPDECQRCKTGSEAIRPKDIDTWERLTKSYAITPKDPGHWKRLLATRVPRIK